MRAPHHSIGREHLGATLLLLAATTLLGQTSGQITGHVFSRQGDLLAAVQSSDESFDTVIFGLGKKGVRNSEPGVVPDGWSCSDDGGAWRCTGPALGLSYFSFRPRGDFRFGDRLELGVSAGARRLYEQKLTVQPLPPPTVTSDLSELLEVPARITPGGYLLATPKTPEYRTPGWRLHAGGSVAEHGAATVDREKLERLPAAGRDLADYLHLVPSGVTEQSELRFTYDDPWGARLVDAPLSGYRLTEPLAEPCGPEIIACQERAALGGSVCVCGCFPSELSWLQLTLDGRPVPAPVSASPFVVRLPLALELAPGVHRIAWTAGSTGRGAVDFEAVRVGGSIDQERLRVGQSTRLEFVVEGTAAPMAMEIEKTAGKIAIQGGNKQTAYTAGGAANTVQRFLLALGVGDFGINFGIDLPPCPCETLEGVLESERATHALSLEGSSRLTAPTLDLDLPIRFAADNVVGLTPRPPIERDGLEIELGQLGMRARPEGLGEFLFETRADRASIGRFSKVRLDPRGYFFGGNLDLDLYTEFSVPMDRSLPLEVGGRYDMGLTDWSFQGSSEDLGAVELTARPGESSGVVFHDIQQDAAGTRLFGYADFTLRGRLEIDGDSPPAE